MLPQRPSSSGSNNQPPQSNAPTLLLHNAHVPTMPPPAVYFSQFLVTQQVFYRTVSSFAIVNLKPLLPGHVLVCSRRVVPRLHDLGPDEVADLFLTVQRVGAALEKIYSAEGLNIAIQDGPVAGQSVPHVHAHIIPRHGGDLPEDEIYKMLESDDADISRAHSQASGGGSDTPSTRLVARELSAADELLLTAPGRGRFPPVRPDTERLPRSEEEMKEEAEWLAARLAEMGV